MSDKFAYNRAMLGDWKGPTMKPAPKSGPAADSKNAPAGIPELTAALATSSPVARKKAREALVALGGPAVPALIQLLSHRQPHVRWEAAKALGAVADPIAASALVNALKDRDGDVRWLAAEGLVALGRDALQPLLAALMERSERDLVMRRRAPCLSRFAQEEGARPDPSAAAGGAGGARAHIRGTCGCLCRLIEVERLI